MRLISAPWWVALVLCIGFPRVLMAQVVRIIPPASVVRGQYFAWSLAGLPAVAGRPPLVIVGAYYARPAGGFTGQGVVVMFDARTGEALSLLTSPHPETYGRFGINVDAARFGMDDRLLVGAAGESLPGGPRTGLTFLMDPQDGATIHTFEPLSVNGRDISFAYPGVAFVPDADGDGIPDCLVPSDHEGYTGRVHLFSGDTGQRLLYLSSPYPELIQEGFGSFIAGTADINADGRGDIITGAPEEWFDKPDGDSGVLYALSGADGTTIHRIWLYAVTKAAALPDINDDGVPDFLGSTQGDMPDFPGVRGLVRAYSGLTGEALVTLVNPLDPIGGEAFGWALAGLPDANHDGRGDILVGAYRQSFPPEPSNVSRGAAFLFSGSDGRLLRLLRTPSTQTGTSFGASLSYLPDSNGDGVPEIIVGATGENPSAWVPGAAYVFFSCPADWNADGFANSQDFFDYLAAFFSGSPHADINADGFADSQDFFDYLARFFAGCP